jgi:capsular polysaccharide biosynthesis protein
VVVAKSEQNSYSRYGEGEDVLSLREILRTVLSRLWVIVLVTLVLVGIAVGYTLVQTPMYEASIKILVGQRQEEGASPNLAGDVEGLQQLTKTLAEAVDSRLVAQAVIKQLNLKITPERFLENLEVQQIPETQFIQVNYKDSSPETASLIANTIGDVFSGLISEVSPDAHDVTATVWERAAVPDAPVSPNLALNISLALVLGLALGLGLVFLLEYLVTGSTRKHS